MIARLRASRGDQRGQTLVLFVVFMFGLVLLLALVIDVGAWKRAQRQAQIDADAAALAGDTSCRSIQRARLAKHFGTGT